MAARFTIVGLGEAVYDVFPDRQVLGGAPLNVAFHAGQLGRARGGEGVIATRIGQDDLGRQMVEDLAQRGLSNEFVQTDPDKDTGRVYVSFDAQGQPQYDIVRDVAWDWLQFDPDLEDLARRCDAVCFGTLAQRNGQSRNTIYRFLDTAKRAVRLFDVNLRQDYFDRQAIHRSCEHATVVKLNEEELGVVAQTLGLALGRGGEGAADDLRAQALLKRYNLKWVALTRAERGTVIYTPTARLEGQAVSYPLTEGADAVGAGDACAAGLLVAGALRLPLEKALAVANHAGAFVASQPGATPQLPDEILKMV
jgi:fructokinase